MHSSKNRGSTRRVSARGVSVQGASAWGVSAQRGCLPRGVRLPRGWSAWGVYPSMHWVGGVCPSAWWDTTSPLCGENSWHTLVKTTPFRNYVAVGRNAYQHCVARHNIFLLFLLSCDWNPTFWLTRQLCPWGVGNCVSEEVTLFYKQKMQGRLVKSLCFSSRATKNQKDTHTTSSFWSLLWEVILFLRSENLVT